MASPSQRYAAARARGDGRHLREFQESLPFPLDGFQREACEIIQDGSGVLVAAPTGSGKTAIGEFAVHLALAKGRKAFYTTPIKALSNQKYHDLVARHGADRVGLLTGDSAVNGEAPVVVMTTEVLRNMMYSASHTLTGLGFVVMDEVHYMADRFRGPVWEEVIINLPQSVQVISLSATVSNAEEFGDWLDQVRGGNGIVVTDHRPVPLWQHMLVGRELHDLFADQGAHGAPVTGPVSGPVRGPVSVDPELLRAIRRLGHSSPSGQGETSRRGPRSRDRVIAGRAEVIRELDRQGLLPAITFIFSRAGCEAAVGQLLAADLRLVPPARGKVIRRFVEERVGALDAADLGVLGYSDFVEGLSRGFAAHHAGMLPTFREIVEELFTDGRIRAVFATETLALGINMPARTVVLEKLVKFNGETHADVTPAEYTQLTGRAGRRGIDIEGHAVVQWSRGLDPAAVAGLASRRTYPLKSSFRPTYNMAVNLVATVGRDVAREILESSFAQFQADRSVVGAVRRIRDDEEALTGYAEAMTCHLGDFTEYAALRRRLSDAQKEGAKARSAGRRAEAAQSLDALRIGDVFRIPNGRDAGWAVVVSPGTRHRGEWTGPSVVTQDRHLRRLTLADVPTPVQAEASIRVPANVNPKNPKARRDLATSVRIAVPHGEPARAGRRRVAARAGAAAAAGEDERLEQWRRDLKAHPCHQCPDREDHARWAERWWRLTRETVALQHNIEGRTNTVARTFERICDALTQLGHLQSDGRAVTPEGERLRRLYTERDLLTAEALRRGILDGLDAPSLAAVISVLVHQPRGEAEVAPRLPTDDIATATAGLQHIWDELEELAREHGLPATPALDASIAGTIYHWARGERLSRVLRDQQLTAGDFVRRCKMIVDLLGQITTAGPDPAMRRTARAAMGAVRRGVVAADRLD